MQSWPGYEQSYYNNNNSNNNNSNDDDDDDNNNNNLFKDLYFIQSPQFVLQVTSVQDHALRRVRKIVKMDH